MPIDRAALERELVEIDIKIKEYKLEQEKINEIISKLTIEKDKIKEQITNAWESHQQTPTEGNDFAFQANPGDFKILEVSNEIIKTIDKARFVVEQIDQKIRYGVKAIETITKALESIKGNSKNIGEVFARNMNPALKAALMPDKPIQTFQTAEGLLRETHRY